MERIKELQITMGSGPTQKMTWHANSDNVNVNSPAYFDSHRTQRDRNPKTSRYHLLQQRIVWIVIFHRVTGEARRPKEFCHEIDSSRR